jgi:PKD repeat protein
MHGEAQLSADNSIPNLSNNHAWLCKGGYANDPTWLGKIHEYNIYSGVMLQGEVSQKAQNFLSSNLFASFESSVRETTPGTSINFTDQSAGNPTAWAWDFGDGGSSTEQHPSHIYQSEGVYTVTLTVNNGTVSHTTVKEQLIKVNSPTSIELLSISSPVRMPNATHHCASNYEYPIEIRLVNKGQTTVSDLVVVYLIDDVEMGRETITTSINVGDTLTHQFSGNVNFYTNNYHRRYKIECRVEITDIDEDDNGKLMYFNVFGDYQDAENWTTYNSCDGMISDISFALAEDKNGNIWSTCFYGASRYNGTSWEKLTTNEGLNENYSWAILNDSQGNIWLAGAEVNTITMFDGSNFTYYPQPHVFEECIHEDAQGRLWFGAYQAQGIAMFNGSTWTYFLSTEVDFGTNIQSIGSDINGNIFVSCYDSETGTPFVKMYNGTSWSDFVIPGNGYIISEIFLDTSGKTWFTATNGTFYSYDGSNWQQFAPEDVGVNMYCNDISEDPWGNVWFGGNHDVVSFNGSDFEHHFVPANGLAAATSHEVYAVYADSKGYLWVGTYAGGISVLNLNALQTTQQHFHTVWEGNGTDHMNFNVVTAKIDGIDLVAGDEIGLFDGDLCVGAGVLTSTASSSNIFSMVASADDGSGNGYTAGNDIVYKLYKRSNAKEYTTVSVNYRTDMPGWVTDGKYEINGTAVIEIEASSNITQNIPLNSGWNIISSMVNPEQADIKVLLQTLIDQGKLRKVMDETGNSLEDLGSFLGGWKNNIGDLLQTEGYKVNVTENCAISLEGAPVSIPLSIPLNAGWNIISFPASGNQDGKAVVQALIDAGKLKKAMNETGLSIEDLGSFLGGWKNNIGDFVPGKGYKINVSTACELVLNNDLSKSSVVVPELLASDYFKPVYIGNGTDHMNINLVHLAESGIMEGDEIGIFDGPLCVGSAKIGAAQIKEDYISIPASMNDGLAQKPNGYSQGNSIHLSIFRKGKEAEISFDLLKGTSLFAKGESMIASVDLSNIYNALNTDDHSISVSCYPNPFDQHVSILLRTKENEYIKVEVLDMIGRKRNELFSGKVSGLHTIEWNGTDENGSRLQDGTYFIRVNEKVIKVISMNR